MTTSEFSTGLVIRGGNTDQNLILLDGITVYNPSHLGEVFSNFIVDGVKEAELIKERIIQSMVGDYLRF